MRGSSLRRNGQNKKIKKEKTMIISVIGRKGGIGKTTITINLGAGLARAGLKVLVVDADGQGNATTGMRHKRMDGLLGLLLKGSDYLDVLLPVDHEFTGDKNAIMACLPSSDGLFEAESHPQTPQRIVDMLSDLRGAFDVILVDTSPGLNNIHAGLFFGSDYILLPTLTQPDSIRSLGTTIGYLNQIEHAASMPAAKILGILPNQFDASQKVQQVNYGWLCGKYDYLTVFPPMRSLTAWVQASHLRRSIYARMSASDYNERRQARAAAAELQPVVDAVTSMLEVV
ncbi:MAG: ParA family protein [Chloroflexi bacterium]|nr:MAG: ParA family protein [Chloroflexota bacterium]